MTVDFDPWDHLGIWSGGYSSAVDGDIIQILEAMQAGCNTTMQIVDHTGLAETHVELVQYFLCNTDCFDYGTSPRGCWFGSSIGGESFASLEDYIDAWKTYYKRQWGEDYE